MQLVASTLLEALRKIKDEECPRGLHGCDIVATRALEDIHDIALAAIAAAEAQPAEDSR